MSTTCERIQQPTSVPNAAPARSTNLFADLAIAFSAVGVVVLGVICAIVALGQIKTRDEGRGLAIASLAISAGWTALFFGLVHAAAG